MTICGLSLLNITTLNSGGQTVVNDLSALIDISDRDPTECKNIANQLARNTGVNIGWGELTNFAKNDLRVLLYDCAYEGEECVVEDFEPISIQLQVIATHSISQPPTSQYAWHRELE